MSDVATSRGARPWAGLCATVLVGLLAVTAAASAAAATCSGDDGDCAADDEAEGGDEGAASLVLEVVPVAGDGPDDGDLRLEEGSDLPWLGFSPSAPAEQHAVYEFRVRNTGDVLLRDLTVTDERAGTVLAADAGTVLAPGDEVVVRGAMAFTFEEVATDLGGLFTSRSTAVATDEAGATVTATAVARLELVAVLGTPSLDVVLAVVPDAGDVTGGDPPTVRWTAGQAAADEVRVVRHRVTVTNTGTTDLEGVEVTVDVLPTPLVTASDGIVLAPGEELVREFDREVRASDVSGVGGVGAVADAVGTHDLEATATATATDAVQGLMATARHQVVLRAVLLPDEGPGVLPAAGLGSATGAMLALLLLAAGSAMLRTAGSGPAPVRRVRGVRRVRRDG